MMQAEEGFPLPLRCMGKERKSGCLIGTSGFSHWALGISEN